MKRLVLAYWTHASTCGRVRTTKMYVGVDEMVSEAVARVEGLWSPVTVENVVDLPEVS